MAWPADDEFSNIGIVDDDVYAHVCVAADVTPSLGRMATVVFEEYTRSGLDLHLQVMKTACLVTWQGDGSTEARREFEQTVATHQGISFDVFGVAHVLPTTKAYKHVGFWTRANTSHDREVCSHEIGGETAAQTCAILVWNL